MKNTILFWLWDHIVTPLYMRSWDWILHRKIATWEHDLLNSQSPQTAQICIDAGKETLSYIAKYREMKEFLRGKKTLIEMPETKRQISP